MSFLEERSGLPSSWRAFADQPVPGGPGLRHVLPAVLVYLFLQQVVIGIVLAAHYSPSATDAWASVAYLNDQMQGGWFLRGLHHHGTTAMVILSGAYVLQLAITRAFVRPRELVWLCTLGLLVISMVAGLTGNVLPWDDQGYWAIQVELGIIGSAPGGQALRTIVQGGAEAGNLTLTRLFAVHAFVLPLVGGALVWGIVKIGRRAQRAEVVAGARSLPFFPGQALVDVLAMALVAGVLVFVTSATHGSDLWAPADPTSNFQARPEWYFLPLYSLRAFFEGPLEPVATMVLPGGLAAFLVAAPFLSGKLGRGGHIAVVTLLGLVVAGAATLAMLTLRKDAANESYGKAMEFARAQADRARGFAKEGVLPEGGPAVFYNDPEYKVKKLFEEHCGNCHELDGFGGDEAPSFSDYASRGWLFALVRDAKGPRFFAKTNLEAMEPYPAEELPDEQLHAVVEYIMELSGDENETIDGTLAAEGKHLFADELDCNNCHEVEAGKSADGPNLLGHGSATFVAAVIRDSSKPELYGEKAKMPKFAGKLSDADIDALAAFVAGRRHATSE